MNLFEISVRFLYFLGIDPRKVASIPQFLKYLEDIKKYKSLNGVINKFFPVIHEFNEEAGSARGHYFHQDLLVAKFIHKHKPKNHLDIGSKIDGFVAHVASFRKIKVFDIRKLQNTGHKNIRFVQADLMSIDDKSRYDSISCLHAIEHFGLGRYGDPINPNGHHVAFINIIKLLKPKGRLYVSFPIGEKNVTIFNAHRIFSSLDILKWPMVASNLLFKRFDYVDDKGLLHKNCKHKIRNIIVNYGCGIYTFEKK